MVYLSKKRRRQSITSQPSIDKQATSTETIAFNSNSLLKVECSFCNINITKLPKFLCAKCKENQVFCIKCLIARRGKEKSKHYHDYHVIDKMSYPLFTVDWTVQDELRLLSCIEKFGLDNWEDIANNMSNKGKVECESHYYSLYYKTHHDIIPEKDSLIIKNVPFCEEYEYEYDSDINQDNEDKEDEYKEKIKKNQGKIPEFTTAVNHTLNRSRSLIKKRNKKEQKVMTSASEILGYWPKREEFDIEYLNDAELEVSELEFNDDDTPEIHQLKMNILKIYNTQLDERYQRKEFVIERNLFDVKKQISFERKLSKEDRDIYNCLKPFARWIQTEQFHDLFDSFTLEKNLRLRLNQLKYYQERGCKTYDEIQHVIERDGKKDKGNNMKENEDNELNGGANHIKKFLRNSGNDNANETEKQFVKNLGLPKTIYNEIKRKIKKDVLNEKSSKELINQKILKKYDISKKTLDEIIDFVIEFHTFSEHK